MFLALEIIGFTELLQQFQLFCMHGAPPVKAAPIVMILYCVFGSDL
jgi:hypothetical protein